MPKSPQRLQKNNMVIEARILNKSSQDVIGRQVLKPETKLELFGRFTPPVFRIKGEVLDSRSIKVEFSNRSSGKIYVTDTFIGDDINDGGELEFTPEGAEKGLIGRVVYVSDAEKETT